MQGNTYLDETRVEQNAAAESVQDAAHDAGRGALGVVGLAHAQPDRDAEGGSDTEEHRTEDWDVIVLLGQAHKGKPRADTKALERFC